MHRHFLSAAESTSLPLYAVFHRVGNLPHRLLHLVHANEVVEVGEYVVERPFLRHIATDVIRLHHVCVNSPADKRREDVLSLLCGLVGKAESLVFGLHLIFEELRQLALCIKAETIQSVFCSQHVAANQGEFLISRCGQVELIFESVAHRGVVGDEIVKTTCQSRYYHYGVVVPMVHLHKQLVERIDLVGIAVGKQFLNIVEKENAALRLLNVVVPLIHKACVIHRVHECEFWLCYNLVLVEIVPYHLGKHGLAGSCLTYYYCIDAQSHTGDVLS